jgi:hypothetical protein
MLAVNIIRLGIEMWINKNIWISGRYYIIAAIWFLPYGFCKTYAAHLHVLKETGYDVEKLAVF